MGVLGGLDCSKYPIDSRDNCTLKTPCSNSARRRIRSQLVLLELKMVTSPAPRSLEKSAFQCLTWCETLIIDV